MKPKKDPKIVAKSKNVCDDFDDNFGDMFADEDIVNDSQKKIEKKDIV